MENAWFDDVKKSAIMGFFSKHQKVGNIDWLGFTFWSEAGQKEYWKRHKKILEMAKRDPQKVGTYLELHAKKSFHIPLLLKDD